MALAVVLLPPSGPCSEIGLGCSLAWIRDTIWQRASSPPLGGCDPLFHPRPPKVRPSCEMVAQPGRRTRRDPVPYGGALGDERSLSLGPACGGQRPHTGCHSVGIWT